MCVLCADLELAGVCDVFDALVGFVLFVVQRETLHLEPRRRELVDPKVDLQNRIARGRRYAGRQRDVARKDGRLLFAELAHFPNTNLTGVWRVCVAALATKEIMC